MIDGEGDIKTLEADTGQQTEGDQAQKPDPAIEREARELGWKPESEWKGEPPKGGFRSAEDFVQRGKEVLPLVNKRLTEENANLTAKLDKLERETADKITRMERMSSTALKTQREQIEAKYEALKEAAVDGADRKAYDAANKAQTEALKDFDEKAKDPEPEKKKTDAPELPREIKETIDAWVSDNGWFNSDKAMNTEANAYHNYLLRAKPGLTIKENLAKVREHIMSEFPDRFDKPKADEGDEDTGRGGSRVEGGSRMNGGGGGKSSWSKIPDDAKKQADRMIKDEGMFIGPAFGGEKGETVEKNLAQARERYAIKYLEQ